MMSSVAQYLVESSTWSVGGLLIGYVLGRTERTVTNIQRLLEGRKRRNGEPE